MEPITVLAVRSYLLNHDGKVRQTEFVNHFKEQLGDSNSKNKARQDFKEIVQRITALKTENGEKYVILTNSHPVPLRKASRTGISMRKDLAMSTPTFAHLQNVLGSSHRERINSLSNNGDVNENHIDRNSIIGSTSTLASSVSSSASADSGICLDNQSITSRSSTGSQSENGNSRHDGLASEGSEADLDDLDGFGICDSIDFRAEEKEWMIAASVCDIDKISRLLKQFPNLASKQDFVYTALHWAAKCGNKTVVSLVADSNIDINIKTGYTALHLASLHGHNEVIKVLINKYDADVNSRDFSGKKPKDVVKDNVLAELQRKLGRSLILDPNIQFDHGVILRNDSFTTFDDSPPRTPEPMRRRDRAMSFLRKKKKPLNDLRNEYDKGYDSDSCVRERLKSRPKSSLIISSPELQSASPIDRIRAQSQTIIDV